VPSFLPAEHVLCRRAKCALAKDSGQYGSNRGSDALLDASFIAHMAKIGLTGYARVNCGHRHRHESM
jgi:aspartate aminotransferase